MTPTLIEIEALDRAALLAAWSSLFGAPAPKGISQGFLRRFLAFEVQACRYGGLPKGFVADLAATLRKTRSGKVATPLPGGRLLREWNGTTHVVEINEGGYHFNGDRYRSLSAIARKITGARWSGPRFFGLREGAGR